jgi:hypothetical protein
VILGVAWALIGYVVCQVSHRGNLATTVVTAIAGAAGIGTGAFKHSGMTGGRLIGAALLVEVIVTAAAVVVVVWFTFGNTSSTSRTYAIASTRQVMADDDDPRPGPRRARARKRSR